MKKITVEWFRAAGVRAIRTIAQTALGMFTIGMAFDEVKWTHVVSVAMVAGIYSLLTSLATELPELGSDGVLQIDTSGEIKDIYRLELNVQPEVLSEKKVVKLAVDPNAHLSQE